VSAPAKAEDARLSADFRDAAMTPRIAAQAGGTASRSRPSPPTRRSPPLTQSHRASLADCRQVPFDRDIRLAKSGHAHRTTHQPDVLCLVSIGC